MHRPALVVFLVVTLAAGVAAQGATRVSQVPLGVDPLSRLASPDEGGRRHCSWGRLGSAHDTVVSYWYWNRSRWLPAAEPGVASDLRPENRVVVTQSRQGIRSWLFAAAASADTEVRAMAVYALGCAGPAAGGLSRIVAALDDEQARVRESALMALGEHAGSRARFRLIRAINDGELSRRSRELALIAYGVAAAVDGDRGGLELRRLAAMPGSVELRSAACAAGQLRGAEVLAPIAADWNASEAELPPMVLPIAALSWRGAEVASRLKARLSATGPAMRLAAREAVVTRGDVTVAMARKWLAEALPNDRVFAILALAGSDALPALAKIGFARSSLRGASAIALAVHSRLVDYPAARSELVAAGIKQRTFAERSLWLLAMGLVGDATAEPRARAILLDDKSPAALRTSAADVLAMNGGAALSTLRLALFDPSDEVRLRAADGLSRHGGAQNTAALIGALDRAGGDEERAALLVSLGRTRHADALLVLRRHCGDDSVPAVVRQGAWRGMALWLRWSGPVQLARLPYGVAFGYLPADLLQLVDKLR